MRVKTSMPSVIQGRPSRLPALLVNHDDVDLGMVDLDDFEWLTGLYLTAWASIPRPVDAQPETRWSMQQTRFDGPPGRRRPAPGATGAAPTGPLRAGTVARSALGIPSRLADQRLLVRIRGHGFPPAARCPDRRLQRSGSAGSVRSGDRGVARVHPQFPGDRFDHIDAEENSV